MQINRGALKSEARTLMGHTTPSPFLVALVFVGVCYVINFLSTRLVGIQFNTTEYYNALVTENMQYFYDLVLNNRPGIPAQLINIGLQIMLIILNAGFTLYTLKIIRHYKAGIPNLLDGFSIFLRVLWLSILQYIFIFLWTLLFVVPGIIAAYRYRMALYLLLDNPGMSPMDCIRESKRMMAGHKGELFVMDLSFIGWVLLTILPFVSIYVTPYRMLTYALYYDTLRGKLGYSAPVEDADNPTI